MFNHALICNVTTYLFPTHLPEYVNITGYYLVITEEPMSTCDGVQHLVGCRCNYLDSVWLCVCMYTFMGTFILKTQGLLRDNNSLGIITLTLPLFTSGILLRLQCLCYWNVMLEVGHTPATCKRGNYQNVTIPKLHLDYLYMQRNDFSASILIIMKGNYNVQLHSLVQEVTYQWCWCFWCIIHQGG